MLSRDLARAFDPVLLTRDCGLDPDPWQAELLRERPKRALLLLRPAEWKDHHGAPARHVDRFVRAARPGADRQSELAAIDRGLPVLHGVVSPTRPPLRDRCHLVIDESGVGRAVGDMFDAAGLRPVRVSIGGD